MCLGEGISDTRKNTTFQKFFFRHVPTDPAVSRKNSWSRGDPKSEKEVKKKKHGAAARKIRKRKES
jgi:hypothetical protein